MRTRKEGWVLLVILICLLFGGIGVGWELHAPSQAPVTNQWNYIEPEPGIRCYSRGTMPVGCVAVPPLPVPVPPTPQRIPGA